MAVQQQPKGITRTDLQQSDLSVPGRAVVQDRVDLAPDAPAIRLATYFVEKGKPIVAPAE